MLANKFVNFGDLLFSVVLITAILNKKKKEKNYERASSLLGDYWRLSVSDL